MQRFMPFVLLNEARNLNDKPDKDTFGKGHEIGVGAFATMFIKTYHDNIKSGHRAAWAKAVERLDTIIKQAQRWQKDEKSSKSPKKPLKLLFPMEVPGGDKTDSPQELFDKKTKHLTQRAFGEIVEKAAIGAKSWIAQEYKDQGNVPEKIYYTANKNAPRNLYKHLRINVAEEDTQNNADLVAAYKKKGKWVLSGLQTKSGEMYKAKQPGLLGFADDVDAFMEKITGTRTNLRQVVDQAEAKAFAGNQAIYEEYGAKNGWLHKRFGDSGDFMKGKLFRKTWRDGKTGWAMDEKAFRCIRKAEDKGNRKRFTGKDLEKAKAMAKAITDNRYNSSKAPVNKRLSEIIEMVLRNQHTEQGYKDLSNFLYFITNSREPSEGQMPVKVMQVEKSGDTWATPIHGQDRADSDLQKLLDYVKSGKVDLKVRLTTPPKRLKQKTIVGEDTEEGTGETGTSIVLYADGHPKEIALTQDGTQMGDYVNRVGINVKITNAGKNHLKEYFKEKEQHLDESIGMGKEDEEQEGEPIQKKGEPAPKSEGPQSKKDTVKRVVRLTDAPEKKGEHPAGIPTNLIGKKIDLQTGKLTIPKPSAVQGMVSALKNAVFGKRQEQTPVTQQPQTQKKVPTDEIDLEKLENPALGQYAARSSDENKRKAIEILKQRKKLGKYKGKIAA